MSPHEVFTFYNFRRPREQRGNLNENDLNVLHEKLMQSDEYI
jgi:hypothetical protein